MAQVQPARPIGTEDVYRPVSILAIVGLGLGLISPLVWLVDSTAFALFLPLPGLVISAVARYRIRHSDGTLAGAGVAAAGLVLSMVVAVSWITVDLTTYLIIRTESQSFLEQWLASARRGEEVETFLATLSPETRKDVKPEDRNPQSLRALFPATGGNAFDSFRYNPLVAMLLRYGDRAQLERVGIDSWYYNLGSYSVKYRYHMVTPEVEADVQFLVRSEDRDTPAGKRREWVMVIGNAQLVRETVRDTPYGTDLREAMGESTKVLNRWIGYLSDGKKEAALRMVYVSPSGEEAQAFEQVYQAVREGVPAGAHTPLRGQPPLLLFDEKDGYGWQLTYRGIIQAGPLDVECQLTLVTDDIRKGLDGWKITSLQLLSVRKRVDPSVRGPAAPEIPEPPENPLP